MADNQIKIDLLINAAESAKTLKEQRVALRELQSALGQLEQGTDAFDKVASAAGNLKDGIADLRAQTNFYADDLKTLSGLSDIGAGIAAGFGLATSALEALGVGSDTAQEAIKKLEVAQTALNSIQAIGNLIQKESAGNILITNALKKVGITLTAAEGTAVEGLTIKQRILNVVQKASPMGILIGVVGALTAAYAFFGDKTKEVTEEQKALNDQLQKTRADGEIELKTFNSQIEALKKLKTGSEERAIAIDKINNKYGTTLKNLSDETAFLKQVNLAQDDYVAGAKRRIQVKINEQKIESLLTQAQQKTEQSRYAAAKALEILDKNETLRKQLKGKTDLEILNSTFVSEEGIEFARLTSLKLTAKNEADLLNKRADGVLATNAALISKETAQEKAAREKKEKDAADAEAKRLAALNKNNKKLEDANKKSLETLVDLYSKYSDELIKAQLDLEEAQLQNNESFYNESFSEFEKYNTAYLDAFNKQQDDLLNNAVAKNDEAEREELASAQERINKVLAQFKIGSAAYQKALKDGEDVKAKIVETYDIKGQKLIQDSNKTKLVKEEEIQAKLAAIREEARQKELNDLQSNLDLAESNLISYNQKVSVLLRKTPLTYQFPESSNEVILKNLKGNLEDVGKIQDLLNDKTGVYGKELKAIYDRQRAAIKEAVVSEEKKLELGVKDIDRQASESKLVEANNKMAEEFYNLVVKISKEKGLALTSENEIIAAQFKGVEFINKRKQLQEELGKLEKEAATNEESKVKALADFKKLHEEDLALVVESQKTEQEFYKLLLQQNVVSFLYNESLQKIVANEAKLVELNTEKSELAFGQFAKIQIEREQEQKFFDEQAKSSEKINEILVERAKKLEEINKVQDPYEKEAQTIKTYLKTSGEIADVLQEDAKRFEDFGRNIFERLFNTDSYQTEFEKALLQLSGTLTSQLTIEKTRFETERDKIQGAKAAKGEDPVAFAAGQKAKLEKLEEEHQNNLKRITENGALAQIQIEEQRIEKERQGKQKIFQETLSLISQSLDAYAEFANRQAEIEIARIEREKKAALDQFDLDMKYEEMKRNDAEIADYQEAIRQKEIADKRQAIEDEYNAKANEQKRKAFNAQKVASISQIVMNTAVGVMQSFAQFGPVIGGILSGIIIAAAAVQTSLVASQSAPEFAKGGLLDGPSHSQGGIKTPFGELEGGEAVINKKSTKMFAPMLSAINEAGGGVQFASGGVIPTQTVITEDTSKLNRIEMMLERFANKPILTYVNESEVTRAQRNQKKIEKRTSF